MFNNSNIFICGLLPRDKCFSISRVITDEINDLRSLKCSINNFRFIDQSNRWTLDNGTFDILLFYLDGLHLVEKGNLELGKPILKAIDCIITGSKMPSHYKNAVYSTDFNLNLEDFPTLPVYLFVIPSLLVNLLLKLLVLIPFVQANSFVIVMFLQVNSLVLAFSYR